MLRIGLILKRSEEKAILLGEKISRFLRDSGKEVLLEQRCAPLAKKWKAKPTHRIGSEADLLVVLGGDGTMLRVASYLDSREVPVLGINLGRVGYMTEVPPEQAIDTLKAVLEGRASFVQRMLLEVTTPSGKSFLALNDAVIHWGGLARLIDLNIRVGDSKEIEVRADGLIVATPLGSSAYSYAANGPLVHPEIEAILLTPICPYAGLARTLVVSADYEIRITPKRGAELTLTVDGRNRVMVDIAKPIRIVRSRLPFLMVKRGIPDYFEVLKEKLGLL